jgi:hypothetical protein
MYIKPVPVSKRIPLKFKSASTVLVLELIINNIVDEDNLGGSSDLINKPTCVYALSGM